jgi:hypothetical protein
MGKPDPPPAPDFQGAAQAQGQANIDATRVGAKLNNPDIYSPYGSQTVTYGGGFDTDRYNSDMAKYQSDLAAWQNQVNALQGTHSLTGTLQLGALNDTKPIAPNSTQYYLGDPDHPTIRQTFSPEQQALFDQSMRTKRLLGGLGEQGTMALRGLVGTPLNMGNLPESGNVPQSGSAYQNQAYNAMMSRINEDEGRRRDDLNSNLVAAGHHAGSKAYDDQMNLANREYNDARNQAILGSGQEASRLFGMDASNFGMQNQLRQQALSEMLTQRQAPLNEITALMSGSQVQNPFAVPGYAQNNQVQPAPTFAGLNALSGYNTDLYNAQAAQAGGVNSGLFGLGSAAILGGIAL